MISALVTAAMLSALGQIESGNNDHAVGKAGELTRYQISKAVLKEWPMLELHPECEPLARQVVIGELSHRIFHFEAQHNRQPTIRETALLWHCPAHVLHPNREEKDYAERFENLILN